MSHVAHVAHSMQPDSFPSQQHARVDALATGFALIARTRMAGLPMLNARLSVEAVGFAPMPNAEDDTLTGILVTPWFMNLVRLPLNLDTDASGVGVPIARSVGSERFDFLPATLDGLGRFESCSLFSPMDGFASQHSARETAREILRILRAESTDTCRGAPASAPANAELQARRRFLFGRSRSDSR